MRVENRSAMNVSGVGTANTFGGDPRYRHWSDASFIRSGEKTEVVGEVEAIGASGDWQAHVRSGNIRK